MSDQERDQDRVLRRLEEGKVDGGGLDELTESWRDLPANLARNTRADQAGRTRLLDDAGALTQFSQDVLAFESGWWKFPAAKETRILERWDITVTRYYQLLNALLNMPEAYAHDVMTVKRLHRLRDERRQARAPIQPDPDQGSELF